MVGNECDTSMHSILAKVRPSFCFHLEELLTEGQQCLSHHQNKRLASANHPELVYFYLIIFTMMLSIKINNYQMIFGSTKPRIILTRITFKNTQRFC